MRVVSAFEHLMLLTLLLQAFKIMILDIDFQSIENIDDIAKILGCQRSQIEQIQDNPSLYYDKEIIPKKGRGRKGECRIVHAVRFPLDNFQKNISTAISIQKVFPEYVQGFVAKRSIVTNASLHLAKRYILNLDIKDFFDTITTDQVSEAFEQLGCKQDIALVFAHLCTLHGKLVQGASTSPVLANLICAELDQKLLGLAESYSCSYSRYADDITFSGELIPCKKQIKKCLKEYGFELNPDKYKCQSRGKRQYVTGLTVFDSNRPRIAKKIKKKLRQIIYYASKYGWDDHLSKSNRSLFSMRRVDGMIAFMYSVEPKCAMQLDIEWQKILKKTRGSVSRKDPHAIYERRLKLTEPGI
jgi:RNA-directed DNA polymerase